jgi:type I restriction enzyme S subunit
MRWRGCWDERLLNTRELVGTAAIYDGPPNSFIYPDTMMRVRLKDPEMTPWVWRYLGSPPARRYFQRMAGGSAGSMPKLNATKVKGLPVPVPPLPEQRRIAGILDQADAIRRKRHEALRLTEEFLRSAFLEMFGDPVTNPKGWPTLPMRAIVRDTQYGTSERANEARDGIPVLRMNNLTYEGEIDLSSIKWTPIPPADQAKYTVEPGDLLFNRTNSPPLVGKTAIWESTDRYAFAGYLIRVRFEPERARPEYVSGFLNSAYGKRLLAAKAKPSNNMSNFSASEFMRIPIPVPTIQQQERFADVRRLARTHSARLELAATHAESLTATLSQRAFRGDL